MFSVKRFFILHSTFFIFKSDCLLFILVSFHGNEMTFAVATSYYDLQGTGEVLRDVENYLVAIFYVLVREVWSLESNTIPLKRESGLNHTPTIERIGLNAKQTVDDGSCGYSHIIAKIAISLTTSLVIITDLSEIARTLS